MHPGGLARWRGGDAVAAWFGYETTFHDAVILGHDLEPGRDGWIDLHHWRIRRETEARGHFIVDRHAVVRIWLADVSEARLRREGGDETIVFRLDVAPSDGGVIVDWYSSCGVDGVVAARDLRFELKPGKPDEG